MVMTTVSVSPAVATHTAALLQRLMTWDTCNTIRILTTPRAMGMFADLPMGVLAFIAVPLLETTDPALDRGVSTHRLRDCIGEVAHFTEPSVSLQLPEDRPLPAALAHLPSKSGWIPAERGLAGDILNRLAEFKKELPPTVVDKSFTNLRDDLLQSWWNTSAWGGLPVKAIHAAQVLGLLSVPAARVESATKAGWKRLVTPAGQIFVAPPESYSGIRLSVV